MKLNSLLHNKRHEQSKKMTYAIGKIFANHICDKGLISETYKYLTNSIVKTKQCDKNFGKWLE